MIINAHSFYDVCRFKIWVHRCRGGGGGVKDKAHSGYLLSRVFIRYIAYQDVHWLRGLTEVSRLAVVTPFLGGKP